MVEIVKNNAHLDKIKYTYTCPYCYSVFTVTNDEREYIYDPYRGIGHYALRINCPCCYRRF